jgi:cell division protein ZapB
MSQPTNAEPLADWQELEAKVQELLELTSTLARENRALRAQQRNWSSERAKLIEKNELAKSRVESMITRLKALEQDA